MKRLGLLLALALSTLGTFGLNGDRTGNFKPTPAECNPGVKVTCGMRYSISVVRVEKQGGVAPLFLLVMSNRSSAGEFLDLRFLGGRWAGGRWYGTRCVGFESLDDLEAALAAVDAFVAKVTAESTKVRKERSYKVKYDPHTGREAEIMFDNFIFRVEDDGISPIGQQQQNDSGSTQKSGSFFGGLDTFFGRKQPWSLKEFKSTLDVAHLACQNFKDGKTLKAQQDQKRAAEEAVAKEKKVADEKAARDAAEANKLRMAAIKLDCATNYEHRVETYWSNMAEHNYNFILAKYDERRKNHGRGVYNIYRQGKQGEEDCLGTWVGPRLALTQDEKAKGLALLEEFGTRFMPKAFANYEKAKEKAQTVQATFNENFPKPWEVKPEDPEWPAFCKLLRGFCRVRGKYFRAHDELAHFYLMHKTGAITAEALAKIDQGKIVLRLLEERHDVEFPVSKPKEMPGKIREFAMKYASESYGVYTKLENIRGESEKLYAETTAENRLMDVVRFELSVIALCEKINFMTETMDKILFELKSLHMDYETEDKEAEEIAKADHALALSWKPFLELLPRYVADRANGPLIPVNTPMNAFYPNTELHCWHGHALGFYSPSKNGFDHPAGYKFQTGDVLDGLPMVDCVNRDLLQQASAWESEHLTYGNRYNEFVAGSKYKFLFVPRDPGVSNFSLPEIVYWPFRKDSGDRKGDEKTGSRFSMTEGVVYTEADAVTVRFVMFSIDDFAEAAGFSPDKRYHDKDEARVNFVYYWAEKNPERGIAIPSPLETRLNEFNRGTCYCEIVPEKKKDKNNREEIAWKAVAR